MKRRFFTDIGGILVLFVIYFSTAKLGLSYGAVSNFATLVWLPSGISVAVLLLFGYRFWPGITLAAFTINLFTGAPVLVALCIGIGNTLEAVVCTYILDRNGFRDSFGYLKSVLTLILFAIPLGTIFAATIGVLSLFLGKVIPLSSFLLTWRAWLVGDMLSIIILTPFLITWKTWPVHRFSIPRLVEGITLLLFTLVVDLIVFQGFHPVFVKSSPITYLVFPPLIWASLRFGQAGATTTILLLSTFAAVETIKGFGPFVTPNLSESLLLLQTFIGTIAVTSMILAAVMTERKELEERKDEFISMASHELKTPVTSLKAYTQILQKQSESRGDKRSVLSLVSMNAQIDKLARLINDLLNLSKMKSGKLEFHDEWFDMNKLVDETIKIVQSTTETHTIVREGKVKKNIFGDKDYIGQVLINLLNNALKYSEKADKIIIHMKEHRGYLTMSVQDFGIGVSKLYREKIFDRFYQVADTNGKTFQGLGLGLYISSEVVKRHGGKIWLESQSGKGSTFSFTIPIPSKK